MSLTNITQRELLSSEVTITGALLDRVQTDSEANNNVSNITLCCSVTLAGAGTLCSLPLSLSMGSFINCGFDPTVSYFCSIFWSIKCPGCVPNRS